MLPQDTADMTAESSTGNGSTESSSLISLAQSSDPAEDVLKAIVFFRNDRGECHPHKFTRTSTHGSEDILGSGTYGDVYRVKCLSCHQVGPFILAG